MTSVVYSTFSIASIMLNLANGYYSIPINEAETAFIKALVNNYPLIFQDISLEITAILERKKITLLDLPEIISIISIIYKKHILFPIEINIFKIIEITIISFLYANIFHLPEKINDEIIAHVKSCVKLLQINLDDLDFPVE